MCTFDCEGSGARVIFGRFNTKNDLVKIIQIIANDDVVFNVAFAGLLFCLWSPPSSHRLGQIGGQWMLRIARKVCKLWPLIFNGGSAILEGNY